MFEHKKDEKSVFPDTPIQPYNVVLVCVNAANKGSADQGYGMTLSVIRPVPNLTLHSFAYPLGLPKLPPTYEDGVSLPVRGAINEFGELEDGEVARSKTYTIRTILEPTNIGFYGQCAVGTTTRTIDDIDAGEFIRLHGPTDSSGQTFPIIGSTMTLDVPVWSLLCYTNAVGPRPEYNLAFARFLVDMAGLAGALSVYVHHNEWNNKKAGSGKYGVERAIPIIDADKLFGFLTKSEFVGPQRENELSLELPFAVPGLECPYITVKMVPKANETEFEALASDFNFGSEHMDSSRAYTLLISDQDDQDLLKILYSPKKSQRVPGGGQQMDYRAFKRQKTEVDE